MKRNNELLSLEKKLEIADTKDIILNKFILKPDIKKEKVGLNVIDKTKSFLKELKKSNEDLINNPDKLKYANIEDEETNTSGKLIQFKLGLGVLEEKKGGGQNYNLTEEDIIKMLMSKKAKDLNRKRIKLKKNK